MEAVENNRKVSRVGVAVIGAGFGGVGTGIALKRRGVEDFVIFEGEPGVGGCWRTNTYPGCACDVPSHLYSYSFEPNPEWAEAYSRQGDIRKYIEHCADKYGVTPHVRFETRVQSATFNDDAGVWRIETSDGGITEARVLVPATGALSHPRYPELAGMDSFEGASVHAARWDDRVELTGKRVAVIGTGASAIQIVPAIAEQTADLSVFQRSASWVLPRGNRRFGEGLQRTFRRVPVLQRFVRLMIYWLMEAALPAIMWFPRMLRLAERVHAKSLRAAVQDPALRDALTPDYRVGCKRTLVSDEWFSTFARDDVHLVTDAVEAVTPRGIRTRDGVEHEFDVIIYATGYQTGMPAYPFEVRGKDGTELRDYWGEHPRAYYGMSVPNYPNLLMVMGPNTGPGHTSVLIYQEAQYDYIARYAKRLFGGPEKYFEVRTGEVEAQWQMFQDRMKGSSWLSGCTSWYLNADGTNSTMWPGFSFEYVLRMRSLHLDAYDAALPAGDARPQGAGATEGEEAYLPA